MPDHPTRKLGRLSPRADRLMSLPYFPAYAESLAPPPPAVTWSDRLKSPWLMLGNDKVGNCTIATCMHLVMLWLAANGQQATPTDQETLAAYSAVTGYDPAKPDTDRGAVMLDVLNYWRNTGLTIGGQVHKLAAYGRTAVGHHGHIKNAIALMGGVCLGLALPEAWLDSDVWDVGRGPRFRIAGGHEVVACDYSPDTLTVVSWGRLYKLTWAALDRYVEEVQVPISADWAEADRKSPSGLDLATLEADMGFLHAPAPGTLAA